MKYTSVSGFFCPTVFCDSFVFANISIYHFLLMSRIQFRSYAIMSLAILLLMDIAALCSGDAIVYGFCLLKWDYELVDIEILSESCQSPRHLLCTKQTLAAHQVSDFKWDGIWESQLQMTFIDRKDVILISPVVKWER